MKKKLDFFRVNDTADFDPPVFTTNQTGPRIKAWLYSDTWFILSLGKIKNAYNIIYIHEYTLNIWQVELTVK